MELELYCNLDQTLGTNRWVPQRTCFAQVSILRSRASSCPFSFFAFATFTRQSTRHLHKAEHSPLRKLKWLSSILLNSWRRNTFSQEVNELASGVNILHMGHWVKADPVQQPLQCHYVGSGNVSHCRSQALAIHRDHRFIIIKNVENSSSAGSGHSN